MRSMLGFTALALVVLLGYQYFFPAPKPAAPAPAAQSQTQSQQPQQSATPAVPGQPAAPGAAPAPAAIPTVTAALETETTIENDLIKVVFTNRGGQVKHWILKGKQYTDHPDPGGHPLDLVNARTTQFGLPLSLYTYEPAVTTQVNQALYQVTASGAQPTSTGHAVAPQTSALTFHYAANGLDVVKTFRFDATYVVTAEVQVLRNGVPLRALLAWPSGLGDQDEPMHFATSRFAWSIAGKPDSNSANPSGFLFWSEPGVSNNATLEQPYEFAAVSDLYFAAAFLPDVPQRATVVTLHQAIELPTDSADPNSKPAPAQVLGLAVGDTSGYTRLRLFAGPKETDALKSIHATGADGKPNGPTLESLIQFGWLTPIAKPLYLAMRFLRDKLGPGAYNWGWAIIIVTVVINLLMLPTRIMMMRSSLKMQRIQPKVEALKKRYAHLKMNDPKKAEMNTEMMALYKTEGVNMYGGCLPMLIQMPLLYAIYRVLANAVELRQAQWFWINDLSAPDALHVLPIIIIISMFLVQFITPSPGMDPAQRRMMAIMMPAIFGFSMLHFASGLALYWCTGNLINLAIQVGINQSSMGREMHAIAAKRAAKKTGGGSSNPRTIQGRR